MNTINTTSLHEVLEHIKGSHGVLVGRVADECSLEEDLARLSAHFEHALVSRVRVERVTHHVVGRLWEDQRRTITHFILFILIM